MENFNYYLPITFPSFSTVFHFLATTATTLIFRIPETVTASFVGSFINEKKPLKKFEYFLLWFLRITIWTSFHWFTFGASYVCCLVALLPNHYIEFNNLSVAYRSYGFFGVVTGNCTLKILILFLFMLEHNFCSIIFQNFLELSRFNKFSIIFLIIFDIFSDIIFTVF